MTDKERADAAFAAHKREQEAYMLRHSTPTTRHQWLEQTLQLLWRNGLLKDKLKERETDG